MSGRIGSTIIASVLPLIADMLGGGVRGLLMTLSGHPPERLTLPHEQEVAAVLAGLADVSILWSLLGGDHHQLTDGIEQLGAVDHPT